jgi:hypothetical protein
MVFDTFCERFSTVSVHLCHQYHKLDYEKTKEDEDGLLWFEENIDGPLLSSTTAPTCQLVGILI